MSNVIVVGGGAAGMMAALGATECGHRVTLLEQNEKLGKKVFITGKGRCNLTNACGDIQQLFASVVTNPKFLYRSFYAFDNQMCMSFFEDLGLAIKVERGERVFPVSDHSSDVIKVLDAALRRQGVAVKLHTKVRQVVTESITENEAIADDIARELALDNVSDAVAGVSAETDELTKKQTIQPPKSATKDKHTSKITALIDDKGNRYLADAIILATGGLSYPTTGADGSGLRMAKALGHTITDCYPALVPLRAKEAWCKELMGLSLKNVSFTVKDGKKKLYHDFGEMLFTHYGVSGPLVLSASSYCNRLLSEKNLQATIDLKPALTVEQLVARLDREFEAAGKKQLKNVVNSFFPARLTPVMIALSGLDPEKKVGEIGKADKLRFAELMKAVPLTISGTADYNEAIITKGGVSVKEVDPGTMESKLVKGLYFAGEMLDVDALTGGYNLQIAWSTGRMAGLSC